MVQQHKDEATVVDLLLAEALAWSAGAYIDWPEGPQVSSEDALFRQPNELFYWRKNKGLQRWADEEYRRRGGRKKPMDSLWLPLDAGDIDRLAEAWLASPLDFRSSVKYHAVDIPAVELPMDTPQQEMEALQTGMSLYDMVYYRHEY